VISGVGHLRLAQYYSKAGEHETASRELKSISENQASDWEGSNVSTDIEEMLKYIDKGFSDHSDVERLWCGVVKAVPGELWIAHFLQVCRELSLWREVVFQHPTNSDIERAIGMLFDLDHQNEIEFWKELVLSDGTNGRFPAQRYELQKWGGSTKILDNSDGLLEVGHCGQ